MAKTLRSGSVVKRLAGHVRDVLAENLQVFDRVPPGVVEEWAAGQARRRQSQRRLPKIFGFLRKPLDRTDCWGGLGPVTLGN